MSKLEEVRQVTLPLCGLCLHGAPGECHTPGCAFWMTSAPGWPLAEVEKGPDHKAPETADQVAARIEQPIGYVVVHEWPHPDGRLIHRDTAGSIQPELERAENHLVYCRGMQEQHRPGSEGRYFIAEVRAVARMTTEETP